MEIVIASTNLHKIREIRSILKVYFPFDFLSLLDFPEYKGPEKKESSFEKMAFLKATHAAKALKRWIIADDSGLVVPAFQNQAKSEYNLFIEKDSTDKQKRELLINELDKLPEGDRVGYYICSLALASPQGIKKQVQGLCEGTLTLNPRGSQGFGYDPLFIKYDYSKTYAEMDDETKNKISHRRKALEKLVPFLQEIC